MTTAKRVRLIYGIVLSLALIFAGICLMAACVTIYLSGDRPFSREAVAESFTGIAVPVYLALALAVGSFILELFLPAEENKRKTNKNHSMILYNLWKKRKLENCEPSLQQAILAQQKNRRILAVISAVLLVLCSIIFLAYGANPANFSSTDINSSVVSAVCILFGCLALPFGFTVFAAYAKRRSLQKEIALVKQIAPGEGNSTVSVSHDPAALLRWALLAVAVVLTVYGYFAGGTLDVLTKAINICTECVGLG